MDTIDSFTNEHYYLSNFSTYPFTYGSFTWPTVEHFYQASKSLYGDERTGIRTAPTAGTAKRLGRRVTLRYDWEQIKLDIMSLALYLKFTSHTEILARLCETQEATLIEGNTWGDKYWGTVNGIGENHLGILLMELRTKLRPSVLMLV